MKRMDSPLPVAASFMSITLKMEWQRALTVAEMFIAFQLQI